MEETTSRDVSEILSRSTEMTILCVVNSVRQASVAIHEFGKIVGHDQNRELRQIFADKSVEAMSLWCDLAIKVTGDNLESVTRSIFRTALNRLRSMKYEDYLQTLHWQELRRVVLSQAGNRCQVCNDGDGILDVHHRTYENLGDEREGDVVVLCRSCHDLFHQNGKLTPPEQVHDKAGPG
jgi:5-methylcytosine-specific restriction endonuclease McrA